MSSWHSYPKVYNVGHPQVADVMDGHVVIEEKIDGSQFSFGIHGGELKLRSKSLEFAPGEEHKMFELAVEQVQKIKHLLIEGYTYRCEYLQKPKHNTICYDRVPAMNLVLFDVETSESTFVRDLPQIQTGIEMQRLFGPFAFGVEIVPVLYDGPGKEVTAEMISGFMDRVSILGGSKIEGVVIKNYDRFTRDGKVMMAKHVSEKFKEVHRGDWKERHPKKLDIYTTLANEYRTPARWQKAIQHLAERGELTNSPKDIGALLKEVQRDIKDECGDEIKAKLFAHAWKTVGRGVIRGLPEWYKKQLLEKQFKQEER